jgi:hypothetical protein
MMELTALPGDGDLLRFRLIGDVVMQNLLPPPAHPMAWVADAAVYVRRVLINLERVTWLDTWGIGWLMSCHKRFLKDGGRLVFHSVPPAIEPSLKLLRLDQILHIAADEAAARRLAVMEVPS